MNWKITTFLLCSYGFLKELRPSEPYLTEYLVDSRWMNLSREQVYQDVYPVWTYSYLFLLIPIFLVTDALIYKPIILLEGGSYILTWSLLLWSSGVRAMQLMQFTYGIGTASEIAYYAYIYNQVNRDKYDRVTTLTRVSLLLGRFLSGVLSQILIHLFDFNIRSLHHLSLTSVTLSFLLSLCLPTISNSISFPQTESEIMTQSQRTAFPKSFSFLGRDFKELVRNSFVLQWSLWWSLGTACHLQVGNYIQTLWKEVPDSNIYNGAIGALSTLLGALVTLSLGIIKVKYKCHILEGVLTGVSALIASLLLYSCSYLPRLWNLYLAYLLYKVCSSFHLAVASIEVANSVQKERHGFLFGLNTFIALIFQSITTVVVIQGLKLSPREQFSVYGCTWFVISLLFLCSFLYEIKNSKIWEKLLKDEYCQRNSIPTTEEEKELKTTG